MSRLSKDLREMLNLLQGLLAVDFWCSTRDISRSWRPHFTSPVNDRFIRIRHLRDRFLPATTSPNVGKHRRVALVNEQPTRGFIMQIDGVDVHMDAKLLL